MPKPKLVLIDGHALAYRAYYALPPNLRTRAGELTHAVYGFTSMLLSVWGEEQPDCIAVTFDVDRTFRNEMYANYKATRAKMPDELIRQVGRIQQVVEAFSLPAVTAEGFEADDVLGTLSTRATADGLQTIIVTGDTDTFQLISPDVNVLTNRRKWSDTCMYGEASIRERYGLEPNQLIDYKALAGDKTDNVPGAKGIGEKTAIELLQQYGTVENIYEHLDEITARRVRTALERGRDDVFLSKTLVTIRTDVPLSITWDQCHTANYDRKKVLALFRELEFSTLISRLPGKSEGAPQQLEMFGLLQSAREDQQESQGRDRKEITVSRIVTDVAILEAMAAELHQAMVISFDVETTSTDPMRAKLVGISLAVRQGEGYYLPVGHCQDRSEKLQQLPPESILGVLRPIFADASIAKVGHNAKYDMTVLARYGVPVAGLRFDTMIAEWLIDPSRRSQGLKPLAWERLDVKMTAIEDLIGTGKHQITMDYVPVGKAAPYAAADADIPLRLREQQVPILHEKNLWPLFEQIEMPLVPVLNSMEMVGVFLDVPFLHRMSSELGDRLNELQREITALAGYEFNIDSPQQLADVLFNRLQIKAPGQRKTATGRISVAQDVLDSMVGQHPIIGHIMEHRQLSKLKSTYIDVLPKLVNPKTNRVHTSYNQADTVTGRITSSEPNLQNIPVRTDLGRRVRRAFIAPPGHMLVVADYSQVELRILAHISGDPGLKEAFARGEDIHLRACEFITRHGLGTPTGMGQIPFAPHRW